MEQKPQKTDIPREQNSNKLDEAQLQAYVEALKWRRWGKSALAVGIAMFLIALSGVLGSAFFGESGTTDRSHAADLKELPETEEDRQEEPTEETHETEQLGVTADNYQTSFHLLREEDFQYTARGYIRAPVGMFGHDAFVDAYLPYSGQVTYSRGGSAVQATAHGLSVYNTIVRSEETADTVVEQAYEALVEEGLDIYDRTVSDTVYAQSFDIAYKKLTYFEDEGTKVRIVVLYADLLQPHYYLSAQITYLPEQTDEASQTLAEELGDAYTLPAAVLDPMAEG